MSKFQLSSHCKNNVPKQTVEMGQVESSVILILAPVSYNGVIVRALRRCPKSTIYDTYNEAEGAAKKMAHKPWDDRERTDRFFSQTCEFTQNEPVNEFRLCDVRKTLTLRRCLALNTRCRYQRSMFSFRMKYCTKLQRFFFCRLSSCSIILDQEVWLG